MTFPAYPLSLTVLADLLPIASVVWDDQRNDELSGSGDARVWQVELADPLWTADVTLDTMDHDQAKQLAALFRKLYGAQEAFWLYDPVSKYPQADPDGSILGASAVKVHTVGSDKKSLRLKGLPAAYMLTLGDKLQIAYASGLSYFGEVSETVSAVAGVTPSFEVYPHLPAGLAVDNVVTLIRPACKMFIMPGSKKPGTGAGMFNTGFTFKAMERKR